MSLYLRDVTFWDRHVGTLHRGGLVVESGPGGRLRPTHELPTGDDTVLDCAGKLAMPAFTCAHHHVYSALARGMPVPPRPPRTFAEILELVWWRLDRSLDRDMVRASAQAAAIDCVRCGVTRVIDHHSSPHAVPGVLGTIASALEEAGMTHVLCLELSDRDGPATVEAGLAETDTYLASGRPGLVGLHASFTVDDDLLRRAVDLARKYDTGLHLHAAEAPLDEDRCLAEHGVRVATRLAEAGALALPGTLLAHGLHLDATERELVRASGAWVVQNPESNQNNGVGTFRWDGLDPDHVLLGTDGLHGDMLRSARAAFLAGRGAGESDASLAWRALSNNERYLARHHPVALRRNDVVILDYAPPTPLQAGNLIAHAFFGLDARQVWTVIADGGIVLQNGELTLIDEAEILRACRDQATRLWDRLSRT